MQLVDGLVAKVEELYALVMSYDDAIKHLRAANDDQAAALKAGNDNTAALRREFEAYKAAHP